MSRILCAKLVCFAFILVPNGLLFAQLDDEDDEFRQGLLLTIKSQQATVERVVPAIAFRLTGEQRIDPCVSSGEFEAVWRGRLQSQAPGDYQLHVYLAGQVEVRLADKTVLRADAKSPQWVSSDTIENLEFDWHAFEVRFQRKAGSAAELRFFWTGPGFGLEPINARRLFHEPKTPDTPRPLDARLWVDALRCAACHSDASADSPEPAPSLQFAKAQFHGDWLVRWLMQTGSEPAEQESAVLSRRMPYFGLSKPDAIALSAYLLKQSKPLPNAAAKSQQPNEPRSDSAKKQSANKKSAKKKQPQAETASEDRGRELFLTVGCLACHTLDEIGEDNLYGGSDLTQVANKRPPNFYAGWLANPSRWNPDHRMPTFELSSIERAHLAKFLSTCQHAELRSQPLADQVKASAEDEKLVARGRKLAEQHRCAACHQLEGLAKPPAIKLAKLNGRAMDADQHCLAKPNVGKPSDDNSKARPYYRLTAQAQRETLRFVDEMRRIPNHAGLANGKLMFQRRNCTSCHQRDDAPGLARRLSRTIADFPQLATQTPAMTPPSLISVGDKLNDQTLLQSIIRDNSVHRPWLLVRMPKFRLAQADAKALANHLIVADRIPDGEHTPQPQAPNASQVLAGPRLVTPDGFGCTSCHQIGKVKPPKAPLNAMGPDLSQLGKRIRYSWYQRWVRNPARIVPRMEMPSVQIPVSGVLNNDLDSQLGAVWSVLNDPKFRPPEPNALRVVRKRAVQTADEHAAVLTDVMNAHDKQFVKPFVVGLPNRHNVLYDLESGSLTAWWVGDAARQRTKGKTWYWEPGGVDILGGAVQRELEVQVGDDLYHPTLNGQFITELDRWQHEQGALVFEHRLRLASGDGDKTLLVRVKQRLESLWGQDGQGGGWRRTLTFRDLPPDAAVSVTLLGETALSQAQREETRLTWMAGPGGQKHVESKSLINARGQTTTKAERDGSAGIVVEYGMSGAVDRFPAAPQIPNTAEALDLDSTPGFESVRLPLSADVMPTALAWRPNGDIVITSLKGRVWLANDSDGDGLEDALTQFSDELAAPFGAQATDDYVDVVNKYGLLRLYDRDQDGRAELVETLASGWGHTADYHDWAVGLPKDEYGDYWIATACQQDQRTRAAAALRGAVLKLSPRTPTPDNPHRFEMTAFTTGHRFPIGIARNQSGRILVTDNQGNYNPFNELNHIVKGRFFGFVNGIDRRPDFKAPSLTPPAVNIPHPWTRSVNGLCFLETPAGVMSQRGSIFGPFEGHLVGAEYDTRRLVRMSLQDVDGWMQGAVYPFSHYHPQGGATFLGPLCCAVSPAGDLYVGCIRDSGWGGANNVGTLVRMRSKPDQLPPGIAEVRATPSGFRVEFTSPVDADRGESLRNYSIASYTRTSTPAYGGSDQQRRKESIAQVKLADDRMSAEIELPALRAGFVYEIRVRNLVASASLFHPAEAFYSMTRIPRE